MRLPLFHLGAQEMPRIADRKLIEVTDRQRTSMDPQKRSELRASILSKGLLHPPVLRATATGFKLVAGGRRLSVIDDLAKDNIVFSCDDTPIRPGEVPYIFLTDLTDVGFREAELEENLIREDLPWQDRVRAVAEIHAARQEAIPGQTPHQTAVELSQRGGIVGIGEGARVVKNSDSINTQIIQARIISENLDNDAVRNARNSNEAFALIVRQKEHEHLAELTKRNLAASATAPEQEVRNCDAKLELPKLSGNTFDLIIADPPYGISAGGAGFRARTVHHHNYEDTPEAARELCRIILMEGFRVTKNRANIFIFCSIDLWFFLRDFSKQCGWTPFLTPIIWQKSESEGLAPWGQSGFRRTYDILFYATKGQRGLIHSPVDILSFKRVGRADRVYAAEKPEPLLRALIECSTLPGESVLDPCCGSGSTLGACRMAPTRRGLGLELDPSAYSLAVVRAAGTSGGNPTGEPPEPQANIGQL